MPTYTYMDRIVLNNAYDDKREKKKYVDVYVNKLFVCL